MPPGDQAQAGGRPNWSRFWMFLLGLLGLLVLNWILGSLLMGVVRPTVPYTFFLSQVNANNVQTVSSTGDAIRGPSGTRSLVDAETRRISEECYAQALATLRGNRDRLDRLAQALLDRETLEEEEAYAAAGITPAPPGRDRERRSARYRPAPGTPPAAARAGSDHVTPAASR